MKNIRIAFDVDGTIYGNTVGPQVVGGALNFPVAQLMQLLHDKMKNTTIIVWSGGGKDYAQQIVSKFGLNKWVDEVHGKHEYDETIYGPVDLAFDDQHEFSMADKNIIVRMK